jgi:hypothetical protein
MRHIALIANCPSHFFDYSGQGEGTCEHLGKTGLGGIIPPAKLVMAWESDDLTAWLSVN